jgi:hypothetical protein
MCVFQAKNIQIKTNRTKSIQVQNVNISATLKKAHKYIGTVERVRCTVGRKDVMSY